MVLFPHCYTAGVCNASISLNLVPLLPDGVVCNDSISLGLVPLLPDSVRQWARGTRTASR